jgi:hypothetical protein
MENQPIDFKKFEEKNPHDLTSFMNGRVITNFNMSLDDRYSVITLEFDKKYKATIHFPAIKDFNILEIGK